MYEWEIKKKTKKKKNFDGKITNENVMEIVKPLKMVAAQSTFFFFFLSTRLFVITLSYGACMWYDGTWIELMNVLEFFLFFFDQIKIIFWQMHSMICVLSAHVKQIYIFVHFLSFLVDIFLHIQYLRAILMEFGLPHWFNATFDKIVEKFLMSFSWRPFCSVDSCRRTTYICI